MRKQGHDGIHTILRLWRLPSSTSYRTTYPTSFTRDVHPKRIHSHNDYWRRVPFYSAIAVGAISVEADVWEYGSELFVGHDTASLSRNRTLRELYVLPMLRVLGEMNRDDPIPQLPREHALHGVFDMDARQTLNFYIDLKTPGATTLPVVIAQLEPLRSPRNFLTHWNGTHLVHGPVTVHLTGDTPFDLMLQHDYRDYFYDAPVKDMASGKYNTTNTLMSNAPFSKVIGRVFWGQGGMGRPMKDKVRAHLKEAHARGIGVRYWDTPVWPISVRNDVWGQLVRLGVDLLSVDDLKGAADMVW